MARRDTKGGAAEDVLGVLDEGIVVSGDVKVQLFGLNALPVKVNLLIGSKQLAESLGLHWWKAQANRRPAGKKQLQATSQAHDRPARGPNGTTRGASSKN